MLKKLKTALICTALVATIFPTQAFADSYVAGTSSGGSSSVSCNGSIRTNNDFFSGGTYAIAATNVATSDGIKEVNICIHYSDYTSSSQDYSGYGKSVSGKLLPNGTVGGKPVYATGRHSFSSSTYGSWYGTTRANF